MKVPSLRAFRLVGGTALSLLKGHRISEDIDMFTSVEYGSLNFVAIENDIRREVPFVTNDDAVLDLPVDLDNNFGLHLHLGMTDETLIKADILNWTEAEFIYPVLEHENIRFATIEEIALMKLDTISRGGRKKDFWDMSEIFEQYSLRYLLEQYPKKYPYNEVEAVVRGMLNFQIAEQVPDPICLKQKHWDLVKTEMQQAVSLL